MTAVQRSPFEGMTVVQRFPFEGMTVVQRSPFAGMTVVQRFPFEGMTVVQGSFLPRGEKEEEAGSGWGPLSCRISCRTWVMGVAPSAALSGCFGEKVDERYRGYGDSGVSGDTAHWHGSRHPHPSPLPSRERGASGRRQADHSENMATPALQGDAGRRHGIGHPHPSPLPSRERGGLKLGGPASFRDH